MDPQRYPLADDTAALLRGGAGVDISSSSSSPASETNHFIASSTTRPYLPPPTPYIHHQQQRRLADRAALGLGLTALFLAIGLVVAWYGYFRKQVNPDAPMPSMGRDPISRSRTQSQATTEMHENYYNENRRRDDDDDDYEDRGAAPPQDRFGGMRKSGGRDDNDIYDDTLGPEGSQRWDWVDRSGGSVQEQQGPDDDSDDGDGPEQQRCDTSDTGIGNDEKVDGTSYYWRSLSRSISDRMSGSSIFTAIKEDDTETGAGVSSTMDRKAKVHVFGSGNRKSKDGLQLLRPFTAETAAPSNSKAPRPDFSGGDGTSSTGKDGKASTTYWRSISRSISERMGSSSVLTPIEEDGRGGGEGGTPSASPRGIGRKARVHVFASSNKKSKDGLQFLRPFTAGTTSSSNDISRMKQTNWADSKPPLPDFTGDGATSATSASKPSTTLSRGGVHTSFDDESLGLASHSTPPRPWDIPYGDADDNDGSSASSEYMDCEEDAIKRMDLAKKKVVYGNNGAPIVIGIL